MKRIPLRPFPGTILLYRNYSAFAKQYRKLTGLAHQGEGAALGRTVQLAHQKKGVNYLVYLKPGNLSTVVHEMAHVCLMLFDDIGTHPAAGKGEPFCYLLDRLFEEARKK